MIPNATQAGLAGLTSAFKRLETSAVAIASTSAQDTKVLQTPQAAQAADRPKPGAERTRDQRDVDLARETVEQLRATHDAKASLRVIDADLETKGSLVDLLA